MKRKFVAVTTALALLLSLLVATSVGAHPVTVDGLINDWFGAIPTSNTGYVARDTAQRGEFVWRDAGEDHRITATSAISENVDLIAFRVTADSDNLYLHLRVENVTSTVGSQTVEFQVGIDTEAGGTTTLVDGADTHVSTQAAWEYLVQTRFETSASTAPLLYTSPVTNTGSSTGLAGRLAGNIDDLAEVSIPWNRIGGFPAAGDRLRFSVGTLFSNRATATDGLTSKVMDTVHPFQTAAQDLADDTISYYVDVTFDPTGEVISPVLITEVFANPDGTDEPDEPAATGTEWIEIYNPNSFSVPLSEYKIGDSARRNPSGSDTMFQFPNGSTIDPGELIVIARNKTKLTGVPGGVTVYDLENELTPYPDWGDDNSIDLDNGPVPPATTFEEQVVLLDGRDTIVDLVNYATSGSPATAGNQPIIIPLTGVPIDTSYERCPAERDTNDNELDFQERNPNSATLPLDPTPGAVCPPIIANVNLQIAKAGPAQARPGDTITYIINFNNNSANAASSVVITDTLPVGMTCVSQTASPGVVFTSTCPGSSNLSWTVASLGANANGSITLTARLNANVTSGTALVNRVGITSASSESPATLSDNFDTSAVTPIRPNLGVSANWPTAAPPGSQFTYTINYRNNGQANASNVRITNNLPANVTLVSQSSSPPLSFNGATSGALVWGPIADLEAGESGTITVRVRVGNVTPGTQLSNTVTITGTPADDSTATGDNTETDILTVGQFKIYLPLITK